MGECFECGNTAEFDHHVVPEVRGGTKTVTLCVDCHSKAHHLNKNRAISTLTKAGLMQAKARGVLLGAARPECRHNLKDDARKRGSESGRAKAKAAYAHIIPTMLEMRETGSTLQEITDWLNGEGHVTQRGLAWSTTAVLRVLAREE